MNFSVRYPLVTERKSTIIFLIGKDQYEMEEKTESSLSERHELASFLQQSSPMVSGHCTY